MSLSVGWGGFINKQPFTHVIVLSPFALQAAGGVGDVRCMLLICIGHDLLIVTTAMWLSVAARRCCCLSGLLDCHLLIAASCVALWRKAEGYLRCAPRLTGSLAPIYLPLVRLSAVLHQAVG